MRVFALGASTLVGYPNPKGTDFPRFLELMLADVFPARRFEIINCGITAVNSHCLLDFTHEVLHYEPDLLVVYAGHNEFIGPYGPTTPFVGLGGDRSLIRAHMFLQRSRLYHFAKELMFGLSSLLGTKPATFGLHLATEEIDWTQDSYSRAVDNYRTNLDEMVTAAAEKGVPVLLSTLVSNLKEFYPLRSECGGIDGEDGQLLAAQVMDLARRGLHGVYSFVDDPRARCVLVIYRADIVRGEVAGGDDADEARFFPLDELPAEIAFEGSRRAIRDLDP